VEVQIQSVRENLVKNEMECLAAVAVKKEDYYRQVRKLDEKQLRECIPKPHLVEKKQEDICTAYRFLTLSEAETEDKTSKLLSA
jgi:hypothetical protein